MGSPGPAEVWPVKFERGDRGTYRANVMLPEGGFYRVEVQAAGKTAAGHPFAEQAESSIMLNPIAARIISVDAAGVDTNGDGKFDRLEVAAEFDVSIPGEFELSASVTDAAKRSMPGSGAWTRQHLKAGRQMVTVSVAAPKIREQLRDSPLEVRIWAEQRTGNIVTPLPGVNKIVRKVEYRREQWDPGPLYGEDRVSVLGVGPLPSGRFRFAEVRWDVTTPGGWCEWDATLRATQMNEGLRAHSGAELPPGRQSLTFMFDGGSISQATEREWKLYPSILCKSAPDRVRLLETPLELDPTQYEPAHGAFSIEGPASLETREGSSRVWSSYVRVNRANGPVEFRPTRVPEGLDVSLRQGHEPAAATLSVKVAPTTAPGRYFIGVTATSGNETADRDFVLDIPASPPPQPHSDVIVLPEPPPSAQEEKDDAPCPTPPPAPKVRESTAQVSRIRVAADVQAKKLLRKNPIVYPPLAKQAKIEGVVRFTAIITTDGKISNLQLVSGHPLLVPAAQAAVSQWVYAPSQLNGVPVEVVTEIEVKFSLPPVEE